MRLVDRLAFVRAFVACWTVAAATAVYAQFGSFVFEMTPAEAARTAFEQPYGKALVTEAAKVFRRSADPRCLAEKKLDEPQLEAKARELWVRYGARMMESYVGLVDLKKLEAAIEARAGPSYGCPSALQRGQTPTSPSTNASSTFNGSCGADNSVSTHCVIRWFN
jgi:hypothetical protein